MNEITHENSGYPALSQTVPVTTRQPESPAIPRQAETDAQMIDLWLHGRSPHTQRNYRADVERFVGFVGVPLHQVRLVDIQRFADALDASGLAPATRHRALAAVKSLFAFAHRLGYLTFDVGRPMRLPSVRNSVSERILDEGAVQRLIALEPNPRNSVMLLLLYAAGLRVSELCGLRWRDVQDRGDGVQVTVFGKGGFTRAILLPASVKARVQKLRQSAPDDAPVFRSRKGQHLHPSQVLRIVKAAARHAGVTQAASPHWLRHAHASHAIERNAPLNLVQATLGHSTIAVTGVYLHTRPSDSSARYLPL